MKKVTAAVFATLLSASLGESLAFAEAPLSPPTDGKGERVHKMHERLKAADKDGDGKISRAEVVAMPRLAKHFDEIDTNKDGFLDRQEMKGWHQKRAANKLK